MDCFTSPTMNRLSPADRASKMTFCTALVSWYSSTMISTYRRDHSAANAEGWPSSRVSRRAVRCSPSAKSMRWRRRLRAVSSRSYSAVTSNSVTIAGATERRSSMAPAADTLNRSPSLVTCFLHRSRRAFARSFSAGSAPFFAPTRGKGTGNSSAARSHPWPMAWDSARRWAAVADREGP